MRSCPGCQNERKIVEYHRAGARVYFCVNCKTSTGIDVFATEDLGNVAAREANERAKEIGSTIEKYHREISFEILIWGPTPTAQDPAAKKRQDLLRSLSRLHKTSMSEENCTDQETPVNLQEAIDSRKTELLICLATSYGSTGEAHELLLGVEIPALIWFSSLAKPSFAGQGIAKMLRDSGAAVEFFELDHMACCTVKTASEFWVKSKVMLAAHAEEMRRKASKIDPRKIKS